MGNEYDSFEPPKKAEEQEKSPWWNEVDEQAPAPGIPATAWDSGYGHDYYDDADGGISPGRIVAIVIAVLAGLLIIGGGAAFALSHQGDAQDEEPGITQEDEEAAKQASMVYLTVYADGADGNTSPVSISILKGEDGDDTAKAVNAKCNERTEIGVLEPGKYRVHVMSVPSNQDGSTYLTPLFDMTFEVAGDGQDMELSVNLDKADSGSEEQTENQDTAADQQQTDGQPADAAAANTSNDSGSSTATQSGSSAAQSHQHNWVAITTTKHHDAVYRTVNHAAVKERRCICNSCNQDITGNFAQHRNASGHSRYHYEYKVVKEAYTERVLVSAAYDETVTTGYRCSGCGATR